jgi:chemotaxis methyl-accepting protein methylase
MPSAGLNEISDFIFEKHGKDISAFDPAYLKKSLDLRLKSLGLKNEGEYYALICADENETALLLKSIYNTFSCFFRDGLVFSYIEQSILPALAARKYDGELRIWSACCASGQEVYSLAMLVSDFSDMMSKPPRCRIIATDITDEALEAAKKAVYDESAVLNVRLRHLKNISRL